MILINPLRRLTMSREGSPQQFDPVDKGKKPLIFLAAASATNIITYGFFATFGVFREYYFKNAPFEGNQEVAYIGPIGLGLIQGLCPLLVYFCNKYPSKSMLLLWLGALLIVASTAGAAFATTPLGLVMTLGVLYGFGGCCIFAPCSVLIDGWFIERRTLANGIFFAASSAAPACLSPLFSFTLNHYSPKATLVGWAVFCAVLSLTALPFVVPRRYPQERLAPEESTMSDSDIDEKGRVTYRFWTQPVFYILCLTTITQGLGHFLPTLYLPTFATDLGAPDRDASLLITYYNVICIVIQPLGGALVDRIGPLIPLVVTTLVTSVSILTIWGFGKTYPPLVALMFLFGASSGGFVVLRSSLATQIVIRNKQHTKASTKLEKRTNESLVSGVLMSARGVAFVVSGFVGKAIVQKSENIPIGPGYGAGKWKSLILFTGIIMGVASFGSLGLIKRPEASKCNPEESEHEAVSL
ncbi:hypothetical protein OPT61_g231 [Boeremia exigua]|uniref:Uncharacterized protein n=1 Tax=Boeremia exigua TaxID=749465 RepID=A0ACC2IUJ8_9PLEO|nr:hypothetical protein OPT61_g231 [Boeremia exigua]